ncbi:glycerophosphodiester phosphodiesterase family protein [Propionicimonas sp.]|uniref:glycerophosphodiester phosphodiesterase n=1 Tax=Propionicimonas sp. TaxID=1955623 RepID=UPI001812EFC3|nr:glycerophosphodiester phosphodiesterase family protein [Propionicimonas sp.]MBU3975576.1 hypothetical protein [Actinomycetota bacterium]MBA3020020.1 hypothetical protein [Propionicimonas sp.]MBU3986275.1 hypothetical protein [Actinomycetota bacterium]MBU4007844.1 hypothetical protein [Actinomycetota bacterium]MBU4064102.1 hypothetical protein [Actinomycetota bacterium]
MPVRPIWLALTAIALVMGGSSVPAQSQAAALPSLEVKAHRGGWLAYDAPEESLKALTAAAEDGVDWVEFDVVFTKDGVAVLQHGDVVGGGSSGSAICTPRAGEKIHELTWAQVADVHCTDKASGDVQPIARLAEVLTMLASHPGAKVDLEVKTYSGQSLQQKKQWMAWTLGQTRAIHSRMSISSFAWRELAGVIRTWAPKAYFLALEYAHLVSLGKNAAYANIRQAKKVGADGFAYNVNSSEVGHLKFVRAMGLGVHLYDFDTGGPKYSEQVKFAIANGQRVLGADNPQHLRTFIAGLGGQLPTPRLVVTGLKTKTVLSTTLKSSKRRYPQIMGSKSTVPSSAQNQLDSVRLRVKITASRSGGLVELAPRNSRVGVDGVRLKVRKGTHSYVVYVSAGDHGDLRVRTTRTVKLSIAVTGYRTARFA